MGLDNLNKKLHDPELQESFTGVFPRDHPKDVRFAINFFTLIGLGGLTVHMRNYLKTMAKPSAMEVEEGSADSDSDSSIDSGSDSSSDSGSRSESEEPTKKIAHNEKDSKRRR